MKIINIAVIGNPREFKLFNQPMINQYGNVNFINVHKNKEVLRGVELHSWILLHSATTLPMDEQKEIVSLCNTRIR